MSQSLPRAETEQLQASQKYRLESGLRDGVLYRVSKALASSEGSLLESLEVARGRFFAALWRLVQGIELGALIPLRAAGSPSSLATKSKSWQALADWGADAACSLTAACIFFSLS